ncbi:MAG: DUF2339 domain-containing protein [Flavisolibacter sp.]|nr:DUF2339 domain-containing protein [Flavisolibacter sp.]
MNEQEQIKALQKELQQLQEQLQAQQQTVNQLQRRIAQLSGQSNQQTPQLSKANTFATPSFEDFIGLRLIHFVGIVVLVIGLSIGVKYAIDRNLISEGMRIVLAYSAGGVLFFLSLRLRKGYALFSAILFSGAMASLYFTTYAAFVYYNMISFAMSFAVMAVLTTFTAAQAVRYDRQEIALLGLVGAYGIPFLISQNSDRAALLFLYVLIINLGVVFLIFKKEWKNVGRVAQLLTWILFVGWCATRFTTADTKTGTLFLLLFFILFSIMAFAQKLKNGALLTTNDVHQQWLNNVVFYLAALFIFASDMKEHNLAAITGLIALFVGVQTLIYYYLLPQEEYLQRLHLFSALALFVLFIAFRWDGFTVTLLWLLVAVVVFSAGVWVKSVPLRIGAIALMGLTLAKLVLLDSLSFSTVQKVLAYLIIGVLLLVISFFYQKYKQNIFK